MQLSIIIPSYNTPRLISDCIDSILTQTQKVDYEIIVVDNGSTDQTITQLQQYQAQQLHQQYPNCKKFTLIQNQQNVGYGSANNQAAKVAQGKWLLLLNSDTKLINSTIDQIFSADQHSLKTNIAYGCQLLNPDDSIQPSAGFFPSIRRLTIQMLFLDDLPLISALVKPYQQTRPEFYRSVRQVDWVTGAFFLISQQLYQKANGFDEEIFMYVEEVELCYRLKKQHQAQIVYTPHASCYHLKGQSSADGFQAAIIGEYLGISTVYKKHAPHKAWIAVQLLRIGALLRIAIFTLIDQSKVQAYQQALAKLNTTYKITE